MSTTTLGIGWTPTPVGEVRFAVGEAGALVALGFREQWEALVRRLERRFGPTALVPTSHAAQVGVAIDRYLAGNLSALDAIATDPGGTEFQRRVWTALRAIPAGTTRSYAAVARAVGAPRAVRAVGAANATNPVSIVIPCHRVIGHDGELRGYAGGVDRKRWLLSHESHESGGGSHSGCGSTDAHAVASG
jgi:methylated-DNA-[protein]-cysteine S-methyltransferase